MARAIIDLSGQKLGRLIVKELTPRPSWKKGPEWLCQCDCGNMTVVRSKHLLRKEKNTRSCGCLSQENREIKMTPVHGHSGSFGNPTPTYYTWLAMKQRCHRPEHKAYASYGGRGITICDRWLDFVNFLEDMGIRPEGTTIDRIDVDGNYEPNNCRWATPKEQANNKRKKNP